MRHFRTTLLILVSFAATSLAQPSREFNDNVDKIFSFAGPKTPGCSLAVIRDGAIVYERGYGMADLDHDIPITPTSVFHVASVSKQFTAMSIHLLAQQGKVSLDDDVSKYIPELRGLGAKISLRQLIHHTSGLRDQWNLLIMSGWRLSEDVVREQDVLDLVSRMRNLNFQPGEQHFYCNTGYTLLAVIVNRVSGQSLREFAEANVFKPLGMSNTFFRDDHAVIVKNQAYAYNSSANDMFKLSVPNYDTVGASSLLTTAEDLAKWDRNFYDPKVGGKAVIEAMEVTGTLNSGDRINYASGLVAGAYRGLKIIEHSGGDAGYRSHLMRFPDQRFSIACLCNLGSAAPAQLARRVADVFLADRLSKETQPAVALAVTLTSEQMSSKTGAYWNALTEDLGRIRVQDGKLFLSMPGYSNSMTPIGENRFSLSGMPAEIVFGSDATGARQFQVNTAGRRPSVFAVLAPAETDLARLNGYTGNYFSNEIDSTYRVEMRDDKLLLLRRKFPPLTLEAVFKDGFVSNSILGTVRFNRDGQGRVIGMTLSAGRVRNFKLQRVP